MMGEKPTLSQSPVGSVLLGRYRIVRELAKGGMGVVYLARAEGAVGFVKPVVVKLVLPEHAGDKRFVAMFAREAQILANLRHASIVDVIEFGEQDGAYIMVLEYVRGYHLGQWAKYLRLKGRRVPAPIALQVVIDVLDALDHAHSMVHPDGSSMHIVHRDISPSNVLLDEDGRARLLDFGVARMRGGDYDYQTQVKGFVGKLIYSAPEIFSDGDTTPRSDCYSCAVVLHEALLGRNTFRAETQAKTLHRVLNHTPEPLEGLIPDVPQGLDALLQKALAKEPEERFASAREFAAALRALSQQPENDVRAWLAALLKNDFGREMAELLGLESLADRDEAWRRADPRTHSSPPAPSPTTGESSDFQDSTLRSSVPDTTTNGPKIVGPKTVGPTTVEHRRPNAALRSVQPPAPERAVATDRAARPSEAASERAATSPALLLPVWALSGMGALLVLVGALVVNRVLEMRAPAPRIRVVSSTAQGPAEAQPAQVTQLSPEPSASFGGPQKGGTSANRSAQTAEVTSPQARSAQASPSGARAGRAASGSLDERNLTRAIRKQLPQIEACFARDRQAAASLPPLTLDFELKADATTARVQVKPDSVANTPLGRCVQAAASAARFPKRSKPSSFKVPVSTSGGARR